MENVMRTNECRRAEGKKCTNNRGFRKILILSFFAVKISLVKPEKTLLLSEMGKFLCGTENRF